ncbi:uncharacterized protein LOC135477140 [Liolophura sinensis]|uniref:uncharacterized protein LOC135477140 n=1 Tax=Liolophura sinensis TaxID=3198878 RepID=UPI0031583D14
MSSKLICALLITVTYVQAASVVKRQVGPLIPPLSNEDPMEPAELGDRGVTLQTMPNLPLGAQAIAMRALMRNQASATPNPLEDFGEPSEFGDGGVTYPNQAAVQTPLQTAGRLPPGGLSMEFRMMLEAFLASMQAQQTPAGAAMPPSGGAQQARTPVIDTPPANPAPVNPSAPVPPADTAPQGTPAATGPGNPVPNPGQPSVFVVPGQPFSATV